MYTRSFPDPIPGSIPPNYCGNAFDLAKERRSAEKRFEDKNSQRQPEIETPEAHTEQNECHLPACAKDEHKVVCREKRTSPLVSLFSRRDGRRIAGDDILLAGLIILLLSNGADEEIILLLGFLFLAGL